MSHAAKTRRNFSSHTSASPHAERKECIDTAQPGLHETGTAAPPPAAGQASSCSQQTLIHAQAVVHQHFLQRLCKNATDRRRDAYSQYTWLFERTCPHPRQCHRTRPMDSLLNAHRFLTSKNHAVEGGDLLCQHRGRQRIHLPANPSYLRKRSPLDVNVHTEFGT